MDTTNCVAGFATDNTFREPNDSDSVCNDSLAIFWAVCIPIFLLRAFTALRKWRRFGFALLRKQGEKMTLRTILLITSTTSTIVYLFMMTLVVTNVANVKNGGPLALFSLSYLTFAIDYSTALFRMVRLGARTLPVQSTLPGRAWNLSQFTLLLKLSMALQAGMVVLEGISGVILNLTDPQRYLIWGAIMFASCAAYHLTATLSIVYQYQRCIRSLKALMSSTFDAPPDSADQVANERHRKRLWLAVALLRKRQMVIFLGGSICFWMLLLLSVTPNHWRWEMVFGGLALPEALVNFIFELRLGRKRSVPTGVQKGNEQSKTQLVSGPPEDSVTPRQSQRTRRAKKGKRRNFFIMLSVIPEESSKYGAGSVGPMSSKASRWT